jgi:hypothetical protein
MKTSLIISAALIGISAITFAATETNDKANTSSCNPGKFYGLIVNSNANIILTQGEANAIRFEGDKKDLEEVHTKVENGALIIDGNNSRPVSIYISVEEISLIEINGAARLFVNGSINSDILLLKVNGSGSMKVDVRALTVGMIVKGSGKIIVSGTSGESYLRVYGTGNVYKDKLDSFRSSEERVALLDNLSKTKRSALKLHQ